MIVDIDKTTALFSQYLCGKGSWKGEGQTHFFAFMMLMMSIYMVFMIPIPAALDLLEPSPMYSKWFHQQAMSLWYLSLIPFSIGFGVYIEVQHGVLTWLNTLDERVARWKNNWKKENKND